MNGVLVLTLCGCCTAKDKKRVDDMIEKFAQRLVENCERICDATLRDQCFRENGDRITQLAALQTAYLTACETGDDALVKSILDQIRQIIKSKTARAVTGLGSSQTGVHNEMDVFAEGDTLQFALTAAPTGGTTSVVLVVTPDGGLMSGSAALALPPGGIDPCAATPIGIETLSTVTMDAVMYAIPVGMISLLSDTVSYDASVSGTVEIAWNDPATDGSLTGVPTSGEVRIKAVGVLDSILMLDGSQPETIARVDANGDGFLAFQAKVATASLPSTLLPSAVWLEVPLHRDPVTGGLSFSTAGIYISAEQIAPRAPFPVADADDDMIVTESDLDLFMLWFDDDDSHADANRDGTVNAADLDYFLAYWDYEMAR